jgi:hypothetical protein
MDGKETRAGARERGSRRWIASVALVASGVLAGGMLAGAQLAQARSTDTQASSSTQAAADTRALAPAPADLAHGPSETLLEGSTASGVEAAALEAVPNGTIIRVETDNEGAAYEAHVQKADGSVVTVKLDEDLKVIETIDGFGAGPQGMAPGAAPGTASDASA